MNDMDLIMGDDDIITKEKTKIENKTERPKVVVLHNDDYNSFNHVHECLIRICKLDPDKAWMCTLEVHYKGKSVVAEGSDEYLKKIKLCLRAEGLNVTIENA
tara:strand:+ start:50837 stop:51142 length:306 start_codon:yes stop_codon:yes gene_type:complete